MVKNPPAVQETWVRSWVGKISWRRPWQPTPRFFAAESPWTEEAGGIQVHGVTELDTTEVTEQARVCTHTDIPCFSKIHLTPFCFYERPTLTPIFSNSVKKGSENCVQCWFCSDPVIEAVCSVSRESGVANLLSRELHTTSQHQATRALNCVCERLHVIWINFVYSLAKCVLK